MRRRSWSRIPVLRHYRAVALPRSAAPELCRYEPVWPSFGQPERHLEACTEGRLLRHQHQRQREGRLQEVTSRTGWRHTQSHAPLEDLTPRRLQDIAWNSHVRKDRLRSRVLILPHVRILRDTAGRDAVRARCRAGAMPCGRDAVRARCRAGAMPCGRDAVRARPWRMGLDPIRPSFRPASDKATLTPSRVATAGARLTGKAPSASPTARLAGPGRLYEARRETVNPSNHIDR